MILHPYPHSPPFSREFFSILRKNGEGFFFLIFNFIFFVISLMRPIGQERVFPPPRKIKRDFSADGVRKMFPKVTAQAEGKRICVGKRGRHPALFYYIMPKGRIQRCYSTGVFSCLTYGSTCIL
ncbi:hypothetical protein I7I53_00759 [Histoplasma capsulatum var. duboisii H88]|uniref:Uncharacterized protein n=1 Tax=Ajellomyces capsulatus (strain H88) TaxID=544711 RepID=A0A8A1LM05_AJEC8|nr:hypothetical protein I7I53_00759 [Histoplasma capsulatum var. duboisii H88]